MLHYKVGLCAFGMSGKVFHAPFINEHPNFSLSAIVERSKNESRKKYPQATIYRSVEEMLSDSDVAVVVVNTPVQTHFEYAKKALKAGKNLIVEKPFTVSVAEADELNSLAAAQRKFISVYQNRRFDRDFLQVKKVISGQKLGTLKDVEMRFERFRTSISGKEHKENPDLPGSGALHDLGAHLVDQATVLFGAPEKVFADIFTMKDAAAANDYFDILLHYENGLRVRLKSTVFAKENSYAYAVHGSRGSFLQMRSDAQESELVAGAVPRYKNNWQKVILSADGILNCSDADGEHRSHTTSEPGDYMDYYEAVFRHLAFGEALPSPAEEIIMNMKIIEAALQSAEKGAFVTLK